jgi:hypothetical protein
MSGFRSPLALPLGIGRPQVVVQVGFKGLPWFRGGVVGAAVVTPTPTPDRYGSGQYREPAKLILSWLPPKKKKKKEEERVEIVENAIEQALEAAPVAPPISPEQVELAAKLLLAEYGITELRRIKYAETLLLRIEQIMMAEMDDEEVILLSLN